MNGIVTPVNGIRLQEPKIFISQGGSSMITSGFLAGMLKAGQSPVFKKPEPKKKKLKTRKAVTAA